MFHRALSLHELILYRLTVNRSKVMFAPPVDIEQVNKVFPTLIQTFQVMRDLFRTSEFLVVGVDLVLHPTQIFHCFPLTRIETFYLSFTLLLTQFI